MANNPKVERGRPVYPWNPFDDMTSNQIKAEAVHVEPTPGGAIIIPRCAPFFARSVVIRVRGSGRELKMENGDFSLIYPFGSFITKYNLLVYSGILIKNVTEAVNLEIDYNTIGADFVLNDSDYAMAVANTLTAPRRADWGDLTNLPDVWPSDPHDHPVSDTYNYKDMITALTGYIDAMTGSNNPESLQALIDAHLKADLQHAHKATLADLGIKNLQDWAMAEQSDISGNSDQLLVNVNFLKYAIRGFANGMWT